MLCDFRLEPGYAVREPGVLNPLLVQQLGGRRQLLGVFRHPCGARVGVRLQLRDLCFKTGNMCGEPLVVRPLILQKLGHRRQILIEL